MLSEISLSGICQAFGNNARFQTVFDLKTVFTIKIITALCQTLSLTPSLFRRPDHLWK
jgi:hypothetical protein